MQALCDTNITCDARNIKSTWCYWFPSEAEVLKANNARELMMVKQEELYIPGFDDREIREMFNQLCSH